jgi:hypothetical protein
MNECEKLIQFNTTAINRDFATQFSVLKFVNQDNYELLKQKYEASIPGYFSGSYDDFKQKRNQLTQLFIAAGFTSLQESYYHHGLSPEGAKAYSECVAKTTNEPIAAWIEAITESNVVVGVRCGLGGDVTAHLSITGTNQPQNSPEPLKANSQDALVFDYDPRKDFTIAIKCTIEESGATSFRVISLPKTRRFEIQKERKEITGNMICGAGCQGNSTGCYMYTDVMLAADPDFYLLPETLIETSRRVIGGPGIKTVQFSWVEDKIGEKVRRLIGHPYAVEGSSGHTQGIVEITWRVIAEREYLVEVA